MWEYKATDAEKAECDRLFAANSQADLNTDDTSIPNQYKKKADPAPEPEVPANEGNEQPNENQNKDQAQEPEIGPALGPGSNQDQDLGEGAGPAADHGQDQTAKGSEPHSPRVPDGGANATPSLPKPRPGVNTTTFPF
jgi:hypothetical protein